jgi:predicted dithiol-disulfide oxidoreductase (DUF899 family)
MATDLMRTTSVTFPNETAEYRAARDHLLEREKELRRLNAAVADERASLPPGGVVLEDYTFHRIGADGAPEPVRMSELFADGKNSLIVYSFMFGAEREHPCEGCSGLLDSLDIVSREVNRNTNYVVVAGSPIERIAAVAKERGWMHHRLISSAGTTYNRDYFGENPDGGEQPIINVFHRDGDVIRHVWASEIVYAAMEPGQDHRANDPFDAYWSFFDIIPEGRAAASF